MRSQILTIEALTKPKRESKESLAERAYHLLEVVDGEKGLKILPYKVAQRLKMVCLDHI